MPDDGKPARAAPPLRARVRDVHVLVRRAAQDRSARGRARFVSGHVRRAARRGAHCGHIPAAVRLRQRLPKTKAGRVARSRAPRASRARHRRRDESRVRRAVRRAVGPGADPRAGESKRLQRGSNRGPIRRVDQPQRRRAGWREKRGREERRRRRRRRERRGIRIRFRKFPAELRRGGRGSSALDRRRSDVGAGRAVFRAVLVRGGALAADGDGRRRALENRNAETETRRRGGEPRL